VVHLSEVANILESRTNLATSRQILIAITAVKLEKHYGAQVKLFKAEEINFS